MGRSGTGMFDIEKHFAFYGAYHSNPVNICIHLLFVWPNFFTILLLLYFTPSLFHLPVFQSSLFGTLVLNIGFFDTLIHALFYICLDKKSGSLGALLYFLCWVGSSSLATRLGFSLTWKVALLGQLCCWTAQFIGHGVFEKRAPAFFDNFSLGFLMAPFFVLLEALQIFFCYEPYPGFRAIVQTRIEAEIKEWHLQKQKKIS